MIEQLIKKNFNKIANAYDSASLIQQEIGASLIDRLQYFKIEPKSILDLGGGGSAFSYLLKKKYPKAQVISCDFSFEMLKKVKRGLLNKPKGVCANALMLPFVNKRFDLIFANQVFEYIDNLQPLFKELNRVLNVGGLFLFSSLGPDTFTELRAAWAEVDLSPHVHNFIDFHDIGDELSTSGFSQPVLDCETLILEYKTLEALLAEIRNQGVKNINLERFKGLTSKGKWKAFKKAYESFRTEKGRSPLTYEVIYGQAFKEKAKKMPTEQTISVSSIKRFKAP